MNTTQQAADDLKRFLSKFKGWEDLADGLERIGQLEQTEAEIKARLKSTASQEEDAKARLVAALSKADKAEKDAAGLIDGAKMMSEDITARAKAQAEAIVSDAKKVADGIVAKANALELSMATSIAEKRGAVAALSKEIQEKSDVLTALKKEMVALRGKLG